MVVIHDIIIMLIIIIAVISLAGDLTEGNIDGNLMLPHECNQCIL